MLILDACKIKLCTFVTQGKNLTKRLEKTEREKDLGVTLKLDLNLKSFGE